MAYAPVWFVPILRRVDRRSDSIYGADMRRLASTILCLSLFGLPDPSAPFDDVDDAALQTEVTQQALAFLDTLHRHWGASPDRLRDDVTGAIEKDGQGKLIYLRNIHDHGVLEGYEFRRDSLVRGQYIVLQRPLNNLNEFIGYYQRLKDTLRGTY